MRIACVHTISCSFIFCKYVESCTYFYFSSRGINIVNWITMTRKIRRNSCPVFPYVVHRCSADFSGHDNSIHEESFFTTCEYPTHWSHLISTITDEVKNIFAFDIKVCLISFDQKWHILPSVCVWSQRTISDWF